MEPDDYWKALRLLVLDESFNMDGAGRQCEICHLLTIFLDRPSIVYPRAGDDLGGDMRPPLKKSADTGCIVCHAFWKAISQYYGERLTPYTEVEIVIGWDQILVTLDNTAEPDLISQMIAAISKATISGPSDYPETSGEPEISDDSETSSDIGSGNLVVMRADNTTKPSTVSPWAMSMQGMPTIFRKAELGRDTRDFWEIVISTKRGPTAAGDSTANGLIEGENTKTPPPRSAPFPCIRPECPWCKIWSEQPRRRHPSGYTGSPQAMETIRSWLSECINNHPNCGGDQKHPLPKRILEILDHDSAQARLLVTDEKQMDRYACLSHRWCGDTEKVSLKEKDLAEFQQQIPQERLYPLLRDAINAAGKLGLKYIWIDCMVSQVCIVQDCEEDWNREAGKMASIYENAQITLAGEPSEHSQGLFHGCRDYTSVDIPGLHNDPGVPFMEMRRVLKSRLDCNLLSRGWVFQESQLSRRFVYFAPNELVWDCFSESWCECGGVYERSGYVKILPRIGENCDTNDQLLPWSGHDGIIERFTQLDLTKPEDRLPALAGLASRYHFQNGNLTYAAGLWLEDLTSGGLFWTTRGKPAPRPKKLFTPTWSWASVTTPVQFRFMSEHPQLRIKVRELDVVPVEGGNPYGRLQKAHLLVNGVVGWGWLVGYRKNPAMFSDFAGLVKGYGIDKLIPFAADYDFRATGHEVPIPSIVCFLFGYYTDLSDRPGREVSKPYYPGGIVLRRISEKPFLFEKIGLFDAFTLSSKEDDSVQFDIGERYSELLEKTGSRVTDLMIA